MVEKTNGLLIGRFQPLHKGHLEVIRKISSECDTFIIGIGSAQYSHVPDNPFTSGERYDMIYHALREAGIDNAVMVPIEDMHIYSLWVSKVRSICPPFSVVYSNNPSTKRLFLEAGFEVRGSPLYNRSEYSGTEVRRRMIEGGDWRSLVPDSVARIIDNIDGVARLKAVGGGAKDEDGS